MWLPRRTRIPYLWPQSTFSAETIFKIQLHPGWKSNITFTVTNTPSLLQAPQNGTWGTTAVPGQPRIGVTVGPALTRTFEHWSFSARTATLRVREGMPEEPRTTGPHLQ